MLVVGNDLLPLTAFQELPLGKMFIHNCVFGSVNDLSISWWRNNTLFMDGNRIETPPLHLSDNNTIYSCFLLVQQNPFVCPIQSREYLIRVKSEFALMTTLIYSISFFQLHM